MDVYTLKQLSQGWLVFCLLKLVHYVEKQMRDLVYVCRSSRVIYYVFGCDRLIAIREKVRGVGGLLTLVHIGSGRA